MTSLSDLERLAQAATATHPGPWEVFWTDDDETGVDFIKAAPVPVAEYAAPGDHRDRRTVLEADSGFYEPRGDLARFIAAVSPDVVLKLIAVAKAAVEWRAFYEQTKASADYLVFGATERLRLIDALDALTRSAT